MAVCSHRRLLTGQAADDIATVHWQHMYAASKSGKQISLLREHLHANFSPGFVSSSGYGGQHVLSNCTILQPILSAAAAVFTCAPSCHLTSRSSAQQAGILTANWPLRAATITNDYRSSSASFDQPDCGCRMHGPDWTGGWGVVRILSIVPTVAWALLESGESRVNFLTALTCSSPADTPCLW